MNDFAAVEFDRSVDGRRAEVTIYRAEPGQESDSLQPLHSRVLADGPRSTGQERVESGSR